MWTEGLVKIVGDRDNTEGKYVVAATDIAPGQVILQELPMIKGPKQSSHLVCVQCCQVLTELTVCRRCGVPLCEECEEHQDHQEECRLVVENNKTFNFSSKQEAIKCYPMITVLRLLLSGKSDLFESHQSKREGTPIWLFVETTIVPFLTQLRVEGREMFSSEEIHQAAGVLDTNTFELKAVKGETVTRLGRALYEAASLLNNSCLPSCRREFSGSEISVVTSRDVKAGEELTICYSGLLQPTFKRQTVFSQTKHFTCRCVRCQDPAELGSNLSAALCSECGELLSPALPSCQEISNSGCKCRLQMTTEDIFLLFERCENMVSRLDPGMDCMVWFSLNKKLSNLLSLHNYIFVQFKEKYLAHLAECKAPDCINSSQEQTYKADLAWLYSLLNQPEQVVESQTKILYGGDLVKQIIRSKLSDQVDTSTLVKLTE